MNLTQERPGYYWRTTDSARLYLHGYAGTDAPEEVTAYRIGHYSSNTDTTTRMIKLSDLRYLGHANFGPARGSGAGWTADYLKFAIYLDTATLRGRVVIVRVDGSGTRFYYVDDLDAAATWPDLIAALPEARLWDVCASLVHTFHAGERHSRKHERQAFLDGRMKKRRKQGRVYVEVIAEERMAANG